MYNEEPDKEGLKNFDQRLSRAMKSISETVDLPEVNGWMRSRSDRNSKSAALFEQLKLYCENSSLNGCKYFTEPGRHWGERIVWLIIYAFMVCGAAYVVLDVYGEYRRSPIIATEDKDQYPTTKIAFPALALCTLNRISYNSATVLAKSIHEAEIRKSKSYQEILELLRYLGHLYDYTHESFETEHDSLHNMLLEFYDGQYDLNEIMKDLTPRCQDVILSCTYAGKRVRCSDIFTLRKTQDGYCCTFNYVRQSDEFIPASGYNSTGYKSKVLRPQGPGVSNGLSILIEPLLDDYFYTIPSGRGWKIIIFDSEDYPDNPSGSVIEQMISPSTETYLRLDAILFCTPDEIISYPVEKRKCIFNTELQKLFTGYTYSDCIVNCRVEDIWRTCDCLPFFFPKRDMRRTCDMTDLPCLSANKSKWWVLFPHEVPEDQSDPDDGYSQAEAYETVSGLDCSECYPACNDVRYFVRNTVTSLHSRGFHATNLTYNVSLAEHSIVHIYFGTVGIPRLKQDLIYYWYELLSNIGGICGVFVGFSLISVTEFLFFLLLPILPGDKFGNRRKQKRLQGERHLREIQREGENGGDKHVPIYWSELAGSTRIKKWNVKNKRTNDLFNVPADHFARQNK